MAAIDSSTQSLRFLPQYWEYRHIARHTVRLGLYLPYCVDKEFYLPQMDFRRRRFGGKFLSFYGQK